MPQDQKSERPASVRVGPLQWTVRDGTLTGREATTPATALGHAVLILVVLGLFGAALYLFLSGLDQSAQYGPMHQDGPLGPCRDTSAGGAFGIGLIATLALGFGLVAVLIGLRRFPVVLRPDAVEVRVRSKGNGRVLVRVPWDDVVDVRLLAATSGGHAGERVELVLRDGATAHNTSVGVVPTDDVVTVAPAQTAAVLQHFRQHPADRPLLGSPASQQIVLRLAEEAR